MSISTYIEELGSYVGLLSRKLEESKILVLVPQSRPYIFVKGLNRLSTNRILICG